MNKVRRERNKVEMSRDLDFLRYWINMIYLIDWRGNSLNKQLQKREQHKITQNNKSLTSPKYGSNLGPGPYTLPNLLNTQGIYLHSNIFSSPTKFLGTNFLNWWPHIYFPSSLYSISIKRNIIWWRFLERSPLVLLLTTYMAWICPISIY